jgi:hypothetical protein
MYPYFVAVDAAGNVFIADPNGTIRKVSPDGTISTVAGTGNSGLLGRWRPGDKRATEYPLQPGWFPCRPSFGRAPFLRRS